jgi:DNA-binding MurR/RpiR family transcriptional regulator
MRADMVLIAGVGNTVNMAANAAFKFCQAGIRAVSYPTIDAATSAAMTLTENDVLLVLSTSGYSKRLVTCVEHAEDNNATILMVTDNPDTPIALRAKHVIRTATRDFVLAKNSAFSHNSMNFVIEMLFLYFHALQENAPEWNKMLVRGLGQDKLYDSDEVLLG